MKGLQHQVLKRYGLENLSLQQQPVPLKKSAVLQFTHSKLNYKEIIGVLHNILPNIV